MAQPNFNNLSQALQTASQETTLIPNMSNLNVAQQLVKIQAALANIQNSLQTIDTRNLARIFNSRLIDPNSNIEIVPDINGNNPPNYPQTIVALRAMNGLYVSKISSFKSHSTKFYCIYKGQQINQLLRFYGFPINGQVEQRRNRLARNLGIQLL
ncbi:hypothetical protein GLOIN_2v1485812 [Rhizophagus clarus]|uniref:Uncharacterized protein n=1 Tax=Rhizophagus clarus TaxID=94130 RepID=A0A8H3M7S2_9GLOM|nr:hypothetical protein GLOIN_2v1485812 [Rhizophagus clarus]